MAEYRCPHSDGNLFVRELSRTLAFLAALGTDEQDTPILEVIEHPQPVLRPDALVVGQLPGEEEHGLLPAP